MTSYQETIDYLFTRLPLFSRIGAAAYKPDLNNTIRLCAELGDPQKRFKTVHIAGTNGKGSVSHMLASILHSAGYKTGLYTSPHLHDFRERIRIDGDMITEDDVIQFTQKIQPLIESLSPSFFEITVAMAFDYFEKSNVDIAIIETGLGGRLDSTNIISPELSIITNIGWDHMNLLGDSLEKIAFEKAGIIKSGVPAVLGEIQDTLPVFQQAADKANTTITLAPDRWQATNWYWDKTHLMVEVAEKGHTDHQRYQLDLAGLYQVKNLITVLESCFQLRQLGWKIPEEAMHEGLKHVRKLTGLHGRWELLGHDPLIIADVAHNESGIRQVLNQLELISYRQLHIITGMVRDKDPQILLKLFPKTAKYYFTAAHIPRALPAAELHISASELGLEGDIYDDVNIALEAAINLADKEDVILVCGSVYLISELERV